MNEGGMDKRNRIDEGGMGERKRKDEREMSDRKRMDYRMRRREGWIKGIGWMRVKGPIEKKERDDKIEKDGGYRRQTAEKGKKQIKYQFKQQNRRLGMKENIKFINKNIIKYNDSDK